VIVTDPLLTEAVAIGSVAERGRISLAYIKKSRYYETMTTQKICFSKRLGIFGFASLMIVSAIFIFSFLTRNASTNMQSKAHDECDKYSFNGGKSDIPSAIMQKKIDIFSTLCKSQKTKDGRQKCSITAIKDGDGKEWRYECHKYSTDGTSANSGEKKIYTQFATDFPKGGVYLCMVARHCFYNGGAYGENKDTLILSGNFKQCIGYSEGSQRVVACCAKEIKYDGRLAQCDN